LSAAGNKELILIAQDVSFYGKDLYGYYALPELLRKLCASEKTKDIEWIRLLYCYEERVTDELIEAMAREEKILKYIDLPIQHVSDRLLGNMRRVSSRESIYTTIKRLRQAMPDIAIRTSLITGLPGETEQDFDELYDFIGEVRFDRLGVFVYSPEEGTDASVMPDQVEKEEAEERRDSLMRLQQRISLEKNRSLVGTVQEVLACGPETDSVFIGRSRADAPDIDGEVIFSAPGIAIGDIIGRIVKVRITDAFDYDLAGVYTK
jgi:ribosomal protein S12 methylthiotransferase